MTEETPTPEDNKPDEKPTEHEYKYECGECHHQFDTKVKYCPACGVHFG